jgi:leucine-zipper-like transcriptional regulator 1
MICIAVLNDLTNCRGFDGESALNLNDIWSWDGVSWLLVTEHAPWSGRDGHCVVMLNNSLYLLGGTDDPYFCKNDVWRSDNGGYNWTEVCPYASWPERWQHASCTHDGKVYISGGWGHEFLNDVWMSQDCVNWTCVSSHSPWKARMFHSIISFNGALYIL